MNTKISVIIPVYNMNKYISKCLDSIINQTLEKIEIITINDGSTDKSLEVLNEYAHKFNYIKVITQENQGQGMAKNKGIINAKGKYITFMDPDDFYPNNTCLQEMYMAAEKNDVLICGGIRIENYNGERTIFDIDTRKFYCNKIVKIADYVGIYGHTRYIYNTNLIRENNISFPPYKRFEDQPFTIKALVSAGTFFGLDKEVYEHRIGHKKENYTLRISLDILCGIKDVFKIIKENNLIKIYENSMKNIHKEYMVPFYKYSFCGNPQIDEQIEEINEIVKNWIGQYENIILSKNKVELMREKCLKQYNSIMDKLHCNQKKIFYGAGVKAHNFIEKYRYIMQNIIGVAVTKKSRSNNKNLCDLEIKQIEEYMQYSNDALVIIVTLPIYQEEIEQNLKRLGFLYVLRVNIREIELAEALRVNEI